MCDSVSACECGGRGIGAVVVSLGWGSDSEMDVPMGSETWLRSHSHSVPSAILLPKSMKLFLCSVSGQAGFEASGVALTDNATTTIDARASRTIVAKFIIKWKKEKTLPQV